MNIPNQCGKDVDLSTFTGYKNFKRSHIGAGTMSKRKRTKGQNNALQSTTKKTKD